MTLKRRTLGQLGAAAAASVALPRSGFAQGKPITIGFGMALTGGLASLSSRMSSWLMRSSMVTAVGRERSNISRGLWRSPPVAPGAGSGPGALSEGRRLAQNAGFRPLPRVCPMRFAGLCLVFLATPLLAAPPELWRRWADVTPPTAPVLLELDPPLLV